MKLLIRRFKRSRIENFFQENNMGKLFCGFFLLEQTPDHTYFSHLRAKIGTDRLAK